MNHDRQHEVIDLERARTGVTMIDSAIGCLAHHMFGTCPNFAEQCAFSDKPDDETLRQLVGLLERGFRELETAGVTSWRCAA